MRPDEVAAIVATVIAGGDVWSPGGFVGGGGGGGPSIPDFALILDKDGDWAAQGPGNTDVPNGYFVTDGVGDLAIDSAASSGYAITAIDVSDLTVEVP